MTTEIVVSACNDLDVVNEIHNYVKEQNFTNVKITVYEKCDSNDYENIKLPNIGREQHTFAYHFQNNYDTIADTTICVPGNWNKHPMRRDFFKDAIHNPSPFKCWNWNETLRSEKSFELETYEGRKLDRAHPIGLENWSKKHLNTGDFENETKCARGAMVVSAENIHKKDVNVYKNIQEQLEVSEPEATHYMERLMQVAYS